jgi:hypothetical protein
LKVLAKGQSEMNDIDCLRLKQNYAWWLFLGMQVTYKEFEQSAKSLILHHFNNHSKWGSWCIHREKSKADLQKLKKYRCKEKNAKLFLQCQD